VASPLPNGNLSDSHFFILRYPKLQEVLSSNKIPAPKAAGLGSSKAISMPAVPCDHLS
jgi:hypothetical protein